MMRYTPAKAPTFYFIGVSTQASSIMRVFPRWADHLGIDAVMEGIDFPPGAPRDAYRECVAFLKSDRLSCGALVTTHKLDLFAACRDLFDDIGPDARLTDEVSCLSKRGNALVADAKDPVTAGLALDAVAPPEHFARTNGAALVLGAGGAALAITWHLMQRRKDRPSTIIVTDVSPARLEHIRTVHDRIGATLPVHYVLVSSKAENDAQLGSLPAGSLVVNATGLGKDGPGSPLTDAARFPSGSLVWELNYRGDLVFVAQAEAQQAEQNLTLHDGWTYFIHGWTRVIAEVFDLDLPTEGPPFDALARIAAEASGRKVKA